jgi:hypothetical protein
MLKVEGVYLTGNADELAQVIMQYGGLTAHAVGATPAQMPAAPATTIAQMPAAPAPPAPPPIPTETANPQVAHVMDLMGKYALARGANGAADARKVLAQVGVQRAVDATPEALAWLATAFASPAYNPPG